MVVKKKRRKLKKEAIAILIAICLFIYILFTIPFMLDDNKLEKLGYESEAVDAIKSLDLDELILEDELYTDFLNSALKSENFRLDDLQVYLTLPSMSDDQWECYDKLATKYTIEERIELFQVLTTSELIPLLVFDDIQDIQTYINDVINNRTKNAEGGFNLDGSYMNAYEDINPVLNEGSYTMLVNKKYKLSDSFVPANLVDMSVQYATAGVQMEATAYESFSQMCEAMREEGLNMYASSTYRSYDYQVTLYERYVSRDGVEAADTYSARPGHSEHQTGLVADLATSQGSLSKFEDTDEFNWMIANAHNYGWILRYPEGKEDITGFIYEPWHWRYVGEDIATEIFESDLTFDEYFLYHIVK